MERDDAISALQSHVAFSETGSGNDDTASQQGVKERRMRHTAGRSRTPATEDIGDCISSLMHTFPPCHIVIAREILLSAAKTVT
jgi:hypothetical protein